MNNGTPQASKWAWNILVGISLIFLVILPAQESFTPSEGGGYLALASLLPKGIVYTLLITLMSSAAAILVGFIAGVGMLSSRPDVRLIVSLYTETLRGIPLLVLLFYIYYALGEFVRVPALVAAVLGFGFCYGAYMADVFRAGVQAIPKEQAEAARSLGMTEKQALMQIVMPQALRTIVPAVGNQTLGMLKDTSLVSVLAITDILRVGNEYAIRHFNYFETYTYIALLYLFLTLIMSRLLSKIEKRYNRY
ncbi:MAG: amino acid ABC transporter permease [Candidatus Nitronauta litoralis]|uniref:Amino acid ABC transporter permease n=1 Tax=Candidatus Nitronauta litoralis TaxID=2705533 RepID=A0A7T0BVD7_9BACT|nr:MAG: amino acid ABC transporter permease [Candidatus Nitronauta litoralis]